ncbi:LuxR C-terminal-related transcriptional regulator [Phytohabitans sp. LJ34]|uniref:helix-turn-helix transcriptional regulator n=1 Tax=Phytohabitans sp. LJ34 TaxID=3452217 RepID=UPI003F8AAFA2
MITRLNHSANCVHGTATGDLLEITRLGAACEAIATAIAVWGSAMDPLAASEVSELPPETAETAIDDLLAADVLRRGDNGLVFRHDLLRQAVERGIGWRARRTAHGKAADLRRRRGEPVDTWAAHVQGSASVGDLRAARWLTRAAAAVRPRSAELAADWYLAALRLIPESSANRVRWGRLLLGRAEALMAAGCFIEGRDAAQKALQLLPRHGWRVMRTALMLAAFAERCLGRFDEAIALLARARDLARPGEVALALADIHILMGEFSTAARYAEQAEAHEQAVDGARLGAKAGTLAVARYLSGDIAGARRMTEDMGKLIDAAADHELVPLLPGLSWLGWTELFLGYHREAERRQGRAVALARRTRHNHSLIMLLVGRGTALRHLARLDEAGECYDEAYTAAVASGSDVLTVLTLTMQARLEQSRGDVDAALGLAKTAADIGRRSTGWFAAHAAALHAQIRLDSGDAEGCVDDILRACGGRDLVRIDPASRPHWYEVLCRASLASGDLHGAREWANRVRGAAATLKLPAAYGYSLLAGSHIAAAQGHLRQSADLARDAAQHFDGTGDWLDSVRTKLFAGIATRSESLLRQVLRQAEQFGAEPLRETARKELERLAQRPDNGPLAVLTRRERQVAELVAAGSTNRQIAGELHLSVKTVERHLARIFTRLDISSRAKLAAMIATEANS